MDKFPLTVLIAEDDPPSLLTIQTILKSRFENVLSAENGLKAFELFTEHSPDIVVSDVGMPFLDGLGLARQIREVNSQVPIIFTTAFDNKEVLLDAIKIGINHYIVKPVKRDNLIEILDSVANSLLLEQEYRKQQEKIKLLYSAIEHSPGLIIIFDSDGKITYQNPKLCEITNFTKESFEDENIKNIFWGDNIVDFIDAVEKESDWKGELKLINNGNYDIYLNVSISPVYGENNSISCFVLVADDITEKKAIENKLKEYNEILEQKIKERTFELEKINQKLLEEIEIRKKTETELIRAKEAAEEANRFKSLFLAKVTHELRTPMNGILGMTSVLMDTELDEKQKRTLRIVKHSGETLLNIINDILDWSKLETGKLRLDRVSFSLEEVVNNVYDLLYYSAANKGIELKLNLTHDIPQKVLGDPIRLQQVLVNIVSNGIKFTEEGFVEISVIKIKEVQNKVIIRFDIRDTGVGIPSDKIEKLFKSFSQIDDNLTRKYGGTGLGLYISKEIVDMMGGEIYCESTVGEGSVFHFTIPFEISDGMQEEKTAKAKTISEVSSIYSDLSLNLLIIEDSYINQEVIKEALNSTNCRYKVAENGKIGVYYYSNEKFDAVLLDIQMPEMDGFETIKALLEIEAKNSLEHTPIIALTAHDDDETIEAIKEAGFDYIITKPIDWENFFEVLIKYSPNITNNTIDVTKLLVSINHNKALLNKLIKYFIENSPVQINNLEKAILENDLEQVDRISHKLKSEVGNFGAEKAINILSEINRLSRNNTNRNLGKLFRIFREEINKVIQYLERYIEINI